MLIMIRKLQEVLWGFDTSDFQKPCIDALCVRKTFLAESYAFCLLGPAELISEGSQSL